MKVFGVRPGFAHALYCAALAGLIGFPNTMRFDNWAARTSGGNLDIQDSADNKGARFFDRGTVLALGLTSALELSATLGGANPAVINVANSTNDLIMSCGKANCVSTINVGDANTLPKQLLTGSINGLTVGAASAAVVSTIQGPSGNTVTLKATGGGSVDENVAGASDIITQTVNGTAVTTTTGTGWKILTGAVVKGKVSATASLNFGSIGAQAAANLTLTVTGVTFNSTPNSTCECSPSIGTFNSSISWDCGASAADTVRVEAFNGTAAAIDPDGSGAQWRASCENY